MELFLNHSISGLHQSDVKSTIADMRALMEFQTSDVLPLYSKAVVLTKEQQLLQTQIAKYQNQLNELEQQTAVNYKEKKILVHVYCHGSSRGSVSNTASNTIPSNQLVVKYMASSAAWEPVYDIHLQSNTQTAADSTRTVGGCPTKAQSKNRFNYAMVMDYFAHVWQETGEHWLNTNLTLSTSSPTALQCPDHPQPHSLSYMPVYAERLSFARASKSRESASFPSAVNFEAQSDATSSFGMSSAGSAAVGDLGNVYEYNIKHLVNITTVPSPPRYAYTKSQKGIKEDAPKKTLTEEEMLSYRHFLLVEHLQIDSVLYTFAVPSRMNSHQTSRSAYGTAQLMTISKYPSHKSTPLLASHTVRVHVEDSLLGATAIPLVQPGETMFVSLGKLKTISVLVAVAVTIVVTVCLPIR